MTLPPTGKTDKTPETSRLSTRKAAYEEAVCIAAAAIDAAKRNPKVSQNDYLVARLEAGHMLDAGQLAILRATLTPAHRGRGRPKGTGASAERRAVFRAIVETDRLRGVLQPYRNPATLHRLTLADAIAEAMLRSNFKRLATYESVAAEMRRAKRLLRKIWQVLAPHIRTFMAALGKPANPGLLIALEEWKKSNLMLDDK